jgi:hypothetical protein
MHRLKHLFLLSMVMVLLMSHAPAVYAQTGSITLVTNPATITYLTCHSTSCQGRARLTYGHVGCQDNACTTGLWPRISGARWVWKSQMVTPAEALSGSKVWFFQNFTLPASATRLRGQFRISTDNRYELWVNGQLIGRDSNWQSVETFNIDVPTLSTGNWVMVIVTQDGVPGSTPYSNPAGLIYKATLSY